jgi:hypothetical protein
MELIRDALAALKLGAPQVHRNLALFPLLAERDPAPGYLLLEEALERKLARVTEVSEGGSVPELAFENGSAEKILLVDGDELVGAKQNRVVNISILVGAGKKLRIPVSCVEQGRWSYRRSGQHHDFASANRTLFAKARAKKAAQVSQSMRSSGRRTADQGAIWSDVSSKLASFGVESATQAMSDAYVGRGRDLEAYAAAFRAEPRQRGAVIAIDGRPVGLELFDAAAAFAKHFGKLVQSYAMDAIETANGKHLCPSEEEVRRFIDSLKGAAAEEFAALGEGRDIRLSGERIAGGALSADGRVIHLAGYALAP